MRTGESTFFTSETSPIALMITVPGLSTRDPSGYFCVIESESFPVGMLMPSEMASAEAASTAS